jgi:hypothetical protein
MGAILFVGRGIKSLINQAPTPFILFYSSFYFTEAKINNVIPNNRKTNLMGLLPSLLLLKGKFTYNKYIVFFKKMHISTETPINR